MASSNSSKLSQSVVKGVSKSNRSSPLIELAQVQLPIDELNFESLALAFIAAVKPSSDSQDSMQHAKALDILASICQFHSSAAACARSRDSNHMQ